MVQSPSQSIIQLLHFILGSCTPEVHLQYSSFCAFIRMWFLPSLTELGLRHLYVENKAGNSLLEDFLQGYFSPSGPRKPRYL